MVLIVDEKVQGFRENFEKVDELREAVMKSLDENVETVTIKKRAIRDSSQKVGTKDVP